MPNNYTDDYINDNIDNEDLDSVDPSKVGIGGLRYDKSHFSNLTDEEIDLLNRENDKLAKEKAISRLGLDKDLNAEYAYEYDAEKTRGIGEYYSDYGKSKYDEKAKTLDDLENLQDIRAREQSAALKWVNGIGKGVIYAGTTAIDGTVGMVAGVCSALGTIGDGKEGTFWEGFYNNEVSRCMRDIQKASEEAMPNYRSKQEQNNPWYKNITTANFWADDVVKNLGFTVGTMAATGITAALTGGIGVAGNVARTSLMALGVGARGVGIGERIATATMQGFLEAKSEAGNAYDDNLTRYRIENMEMNEDGTSAQEIMYQFGGPDAVRAKVEENNKRLQELRNWRFNMGFGDGLLPEELPKGIPDEVRNNFKVKRWATSSINIETGQKEEKQIDATDEEVEQFRSIKEEEKRLYKENTKLTKAIYYDEDAQLQARKSANTLMASELIILGPSNSVGIFSGLKNFFHNTSRQVSLGITRGARPWVDRGAILGERFLTEGVWEEMGQGWETRFTADMYSNKYNYEKRQQLGESVNVTLEAMKEGFIKQYGTAEGWQDGVVGGICGIIPTFYPHKVRNSDGSVETKLFTGGLCDVFGKDFNEAVRVGTAIREFENRSTMEQKFNYLTEQSVLEDMKRKALADGDKFTYENTSTKQLTNTILNYMAAGKLDDFKALLGNPEVDDEELDALIHASTGKDANGKVVNNYGLTDKNGNLLITTPEQREEYKKKLGEHRKTTLKLIDRLQRSMDYIDNKTEGALTNEQLANLAWVSVFPDSLRDRHDSLVDQIVNGKKTDNGNEVSLNNLRKLIGRYLGENDESASDEDKDEELDALSNFIANRIDDDNDGLESEGQRKLREAYNKYSKNHSKEDKLKFSRAWLKRQKINYGLEYIYENLDKKGKDGRTNAEHLADIIDNEDIFGISQEEKEHLVECLKDVSKLNKLENIYRKMGEKYLKTKPSKLKKEFELTENMFKSDLNQRRANSINKDIDKALEKFGDSDSTKRQIYDELKNLKNSVIGIPEVWNLLLKGKHGKWLKGARNMDSFEDSLNSIVDEDESLSEDDKKRVKRALNGMLFNSISTPKEMFENFDSDKPNFSFKGYSAEDFIFGDSEDLEEFMNLNKDYLIREAVSNGAQFLYNQSTGKLDLSEEDMSKLMDLAKSILARDAFERAKALLSKAKEFYSEVEEWTNNVEDKEKVASMVKSMDSVEVSDNINYGNASNSPSVESVLDASAESVIKEFEDNLEIMTGRAVTYITSLSSFAKKVLDIITNKNIDNSVNAEMVGYFIALNSFFDLDKLCNVVYDGNNMDFMKNIYACIYEENLKAAIANMIVNNNVDDGIIFNSLKDIVYSAVEVKNRLGNTYTFNENDDLFDEAVNINNVENAAKNINTIIQALIDKLKSNENISSEDKNGLSSALTSIYKSGLYSAAENTKDANLAIIKSNISEGKLFTEDDLAKLAVDFNKSIEKVVEKEKKKREEEEKEAEKKAKEELATKINSEANGENGNESQKEATNVTQEDIDNFIESKVKVDEEGNAKIELDNNEIRELFKIEKNGKKVSILQPLTSQMYIPSMRTGDYVMFSQGADYGNINYHTDPHEVEDYLSHIKIKTKKADGTYEDSYISAFEQLNNGGIYNIWENGVYHHQLFAMTDEEFNNIYNSNPDGSPKNYYWRLGSAQNGVDTYYMYENEVLELDKNGNAVSLKSKDGGPLKIMKDENGKNVIRSEYTGDITVTRKDSKGKKKSESVSMKDVIHHFRKPSLKANIFFAVKDDDGNLIPIGLMPRIEDNENSRKDNIYSESGLGLQTFLNIMFGRTYGVNSVEKDYFDSKVTVSTNLGGISNGDLTTEELPERSVGNLKGQSYRMYQGTNKEGYTLREIYAAEAYDYFSRHIGGKGLDDKTILDVHFEDEAKDENGNVTYKSVCVKYKDGRTYKYYRNRVNDRINNLGKNSEGFIFFDNESKKGIMKRQSSNGIVTNKYYANPNDKENAKQFQESVKEADRLGSMLNMLFDITGNEYMSEVGEMNERSTVTENGETREVNKSHKIETKRAVRLRGYTIDKFINGVFMTNKKGVYNDLSSIKDGYGNSVANMIEDGLATIGVVVKTTTGCIVKDSNGSEFIQDGKTSEALRNGMSVLIVENADGTKSYIPLGTARYKKETKEKFDKNLNIRVYFENALKELRESIKNIKNIKDDKERKTAMNNAVLKAFNHINEVISIPINKIFVSNGVEQKFHANLGEINGKFVLFMERTTADGSAIEDSNEKINLEDEDENVLKYLSESIARIGRPLKISDSNLNDTEYIGKLIENGVFTTSLKSLAPVNAYFQVAREDITQEERDASNKVFKTYSQLLANIEKLKNKKLNEGVATAKFANSEIIVVSDDFGFNYEIYYKDGRKLKTDEIRALEKDLGFDAHAPWNIRDIYEIATKYYPVYQEIKNNSGELSDMAKKIKSVVHGSIVRIRKMYRNVPILAYYDFETGNVYWTSDEFDNAAKVNNVVVDGKVDDSKLIGQQQGESTTNNQTGQSQSQDDIKMNYEEVEQGFSSDNGSSSDESNVDLSDDNIRPDTSTNDDDEQEFFRVSNNEQERTKEETMDEIEYMEQALPWLSLGERVQVLHGLDRVASNGTHAWGAFKNGCIYLYENAAQGTMYHEAYHAVSQLCLTDKERQALYDELREKLGQSGLSNLECEEKLADMFKDYVISERSSNLSIWKRIAKWFSELWHKINVFRNSTDRIDNLFSNILKGSYSGYFDSISSIYENSQELNAIGTKEQYIDYVNEMTKNSKIKGIAYTTDHVMENGEYLVLQRQDNRPISSSDMNTIGKQVGVDTSVYADFEAYNRLSRPCYVVVNNNPKSVRNGLFKGVKYSTSAKPIELGSPEDMNGFREYIKSNKMDKNINRRKWENGLTAENKSLLNARGITIEEFDRMPNVVKDKLMECL